MFIRTKQSVHARRTVVQIVENTRIDGKTKQRVIRHVGTAHTPEELEQLKRLALPLKIRLEQAAMLNKKKPLETRAVAAGESILPKLKTVPIKTMVDVSGLQETSKHILGVHDVYGYIYQEIGFTNLFSAPSRHENSAKILREVVLGRIAFSRSKRSTAEKLKKHCGVDLNLDRIYQMMDKIDDGFCDRIQESTLAATLRLTGEKLKVLFYDATTLYFESFTEDDLKQNGYSKDMKFNQPQVLFALFVTKDGLPVGYELFPGATYEGHTLQPVLEKLKKRYQIDEMIFVADRGMLSTENLNYLDANGIPYIVGARLKSLTKLKQQEILSWGEATKANIKDGQEHETEKNQVAFEFTHSIDISDKKRMVLCYSKKRAEKDKHDREKSILKLKNKLSKSKNPKTVISNYGYQKFLKIEGEASLVIDEKKLSAESAWDGLFGVYTNQSNFTNEEILNHYRSLWQVEESFRINKHDLSIRPIYHWAPERVKAHVAISFMAFACVRHLEYRVALQYKKLSPEVIRDALLDVQVSIIKDTIVGKQYVLPAQISPQAKQIYRIAGLKPMTSIKQICGA